MFKQVSVKLAVLMMVMAGFVFISTAQVSAMGGTPKKEIKVSEQEEPSGTVSEESTEQPSSYMDSSESGESMDEGSGAAEDESTQQEEGEGEETSSPDYDSPEY